jgi:hypothetical protein
MFAADEEPTPDQCVDTLHDHTELIDAGWDMHRPWEERTAWEPGPKGAPSRIKWARFVRQALGRYIE